MYADFSSSLAFCHISPTFMEKNASQLTRQGYVYYSSRQDHAQ